MHSEYIIYCMHEKTHETVISNHKMKHSEGNNQQT